MIYDLKNHIIETDEIEQITPIYTDYTIMEDCFKVYLKTSYVVIRGDDSRELREGLVKFWKGEKG